MSSEFLEKIRNVIVILLVLFISILNTWIAFFSLPVHAAGTWTLSSNVGNHTLVVSHYYKGNYSAPRLGYINFWSKQRKYNFCFIIALLRKVDNFSM